jgi:hypothetical protein
MLPEVERVAADYGLPCQKLRNRCTSDGLDAEQEKERGPIDPARRRSGASMDELADWRGHPLSGYSRQSILTPCRTLIFSEEEHIAVTVAVRRTIVDDRYALSPRLAPLKSALAKLAPRRRVTPDQPQTAVRRAGTRPRWPPDAASRDRMTRKLALIGCGLLVVVVLTHVAERWQIFPGMGWGQPDSPGHYLALASAISAAGCFLASFLVGR